jgi:hypothetical protein
MSPYAVLTESTLALLSPGRRPAGANRYFSARTTRPRIGDAKAAAEVFKHIADRDRAANKKAAGPWGASGRT